MKRSRGFTLVELMVVVAIIALLAAVAVPRLGGKGRSARDTDSWSRTLVSMLDQMHTRAMSERRSLRTTIRNNSATLESRTTAGAWVVEQTRTAPNEARVWDVLYSGSAPTAIMAAATTHTVQFNPDFTVSVDAGAALNANIYVGGSTPTGVVATERGRQYLITVIASGAVARTDTWQ